MARANNNGWDFVEVGKTYQYKEDWFIATVTILEDNSTKNRYRFKLQTEKSNEKPPTKNGIFSIEHDKTLKGVFSGKFQFYENEE